MKRTRYRRCKPTLLPLGSVSHGTLLPEDLLDAFLDAANSIRLSRSERSSVRAIERRFLNSPDDPDEDAPVIAGVDEAPDAASEDVTTLEDILNGHVPDYCYFGAHEGDGADFGVWISWDAVDQDRGGEIANSREDANDEPCQDFWLDVNDHGNATLYRRVGKRDLWRECWFTV